MGSRASSGIANLDGFSRLEAFAQAMQDAGELMAKRYAGNLALQTGLFSELTEMLENVLIVDF